MLVACPVVCCGGLQSRPPQATIAGTLSRDNVFQRLAPSTYALQPIIAHERRKAAAAAKAAKAAEAAVKAEQAAAAVKAEHKGEGEGKGHEDSDDEGVARGHEAQVWVSCRVWMRRVA